MMGSSNKKNDMVDEERTPAWRNKGPTFETHLNEKADYSVVGVQKVTSILNFVLLGVMVCSSPNLQIQVLNWNKESGQVPSGARLQK